MHVLDTSALIEVVHGTKEGGRIIDRLDSGQAAITSLTVFEIFRNLKASEAEVFRKVLFGINVLDFDSAAAAESVKIEKELSSTGEKIGVVNVMIAGICKKYNFALITADKDFNKVRGLKVFLCAS